MESRKRATWPKDPIGGTNKLVDFIKLRLLFCGWSRPAAESVSTGFHKLCFALSTSPRDRDISGDISVDVVVGHRIVRKATAREDRVKKPIAPKGNIKSKATEAIEAFIFVGRESLGEMNPDDCWRTK
jgi:hypothetical protein